MATKKVLFTTLKVGDKFTVSDQSCKKVSALTYEDLQNSILGEFYATPAMFVQIEVAKPVAKKAVAKKAAKR
jgi:hypothetical protein